MTLDAILAGFGLGISLILAIGAQNAFVLRQGLRQEHVFLVCTICALSDAALICFGVFGFSYLIHQLPWLTQAIRYAGTAFLIAYGARCFWAAWRSPHALNNPSNIPSRSRLRTAMMCLSVTWLNPHVYLDTVLFMGSVSTQFVNYEAPFALGAMTASLVFFFMLGYGAYFLRPLFAKPAAWRILDFFIGVIMWSIAAKLFFI